MARIVRNKTIIFSTKEELEKFNHCLNQDTVDISAKKLQKEVEKDGIKITRENAQK